MIVSFQHPGDFMTKFMRFMLFCNFFPAIPSPSFTELQIKSSDDRLMPVNNDESEIFLSWCIFQMTLQIFRSTSSCISAQHLSPPYWQYHDSTSLCLSGYNV